MCKIKLLIRHHHHPAPNTLLPQFSPLSICHVILPAAPLFFSYPTSNPSAYTAGFFFKIYPELDYFLQPGTHFPQGKGQKFQQAWLKLPKPIKAPASNGTLTLLPTFYWPEQVTWRSSIPMR